jgi:hypothetical protein
MAVPYHVIDFVHTNQTRSKFKHIVAQRNNNELRILRPFLYVACHNGHLESGQLSCVERDVNEMYSHSGNLEQHQFRPLHKEEWACSDEEQTPMPNYSVSSLHR